MKAMMRGLVPFAGVWLAVACTSATEGPVKTATQHLAKFESRASLIGRVVDTGGNPVSGAVLSVYDAPDGPQRTDLSATTASDGSFRVQLTQFSTRVLATDPALHEILYIDAPNSVRAYRDAFLRSGDVVDVGTIQVVQRDSAITNIGPAGGTASDSAGLVTLTIPVGALATTVPIQITPYTTRDQVPAPLPPATLTTYAFTLEPEGTTFASPITVTVKNWRDVPPNIAMPVGVYEPTFGSWEHETKASYGSSGWSFSTNHFSTWDVNASTLGDLILRWLNGRKPNDSEKGCMGSTVGLANGSLQQTFLLPTHNVRNEPFGVTLHYDSGLAGSRHFNNNLTNQSVAGSIAFSGMTVATTSTTLQAQCVPRGAASTGKSLDSCNAGSCALGSAAAQIVATTSTAGNLTTNTQSTQANQPSVDDGSFVNVPLDDQGEPIDTAFVPQTSTLNLVVPTATACGSVALNPIFGVNMGGDSGQTVSLAPSPIAVNSHVFIHHRFNSPYGAGWAIREIDRLYTDGPDHAVLVNGDGTEEEFRPYTTLTFGKTYSNSFTYFAFARDRTTNEDFVVTKFGELDKADPNNLAAPTTIYSGLSVPGKPQGLAVGYVNSSRVFLGAFDTGLVTINNGTVTTIQSRTVPPSPSLFNQAHVASCGGNLAYYTDGINPVLYQVDLSNSAVTALSVATGGDQRLDPKATLSGVQFAFPAGIACDSTTNTVYVADRKKNVIYAIAQDGSGDIGPTSAVTRILGDGYGGVLPPVGDHASSIAFGVNTPVYLSTWDDGTLVIGTLYGLASYSPTSKDATWFTFNKNAAKSDLTIDFNNGSQEEVGDLLALGGKTVLTRAYDNELVKVDGATLASVYDPTKYLVAGTTYTLEDPLGDRKEAFDSEGRLIERDHFTGEPIVAHVQYVDSASNAVQTIWDAAGGVTTFNYDPNGKLESIVDPQSRTTSVSVDAATHDLLSFAEPDSETYTFVYSGHQMTSKQSPAGDMSHYEYDANGILTKSTKPNNEFTTFAPPMAQAPTKDSAGNPTRTGSYTDMHGVTHTIVVNRIGQVETDSFTADNVAYSRQAIYDPYLWGNPGNTSDPLTRLNNIFRVQYHTLNGMQEDLMRRYDDRGRLFVVHDTNSDGYYGGRLRFTYDASGELAAYTGPSSYDIHNIVRDGAGHITRIYVPNGGGILGPEVDYTYNRPDGQPDTATVHGVTYNLGYDSVTGNLLSSHDTGALGLTTTLTRDQYGNIQTANDGVASWFFSYDQNNRLWVAIDGGNYPTTYGYALQGCGCSEQERVTTIHTPDLPGGVNWTLAYWPEGRLKSLTDPDGHTTSMSYQPTGELSQVTDPKLHGATMGYDSLGRLSSALDALQRAHSRTYPIPTSTGWSGTTVMSSGPDSTPVTTDFTAALSDGQYQIGLNLFQQKGDPAQVSFYRDPTFEISYGVGWDQARRMTRRRDRVGTPISSSTAIPSGYGQYDEVQPSYSLSTSLPVLSSVTSSMSSLYESSSFTQNADLEDTLQKGWQSRLPWVIDTLSRDSAGRITNHQRQFVPGNGGTGVDAVPYLGSNFYAKSTSYTYSPTNGRVTNFGDADGSHDVTYDNRGLVHTINVTYLQVTGAAEGTYTFNYDATGRNTDVLYPGGFERTQAYDNEGRITSRCYKYNGLADRCYTAHYDAAGNPDTMSDPDGSYDFAYDGLDRLTQSARHVAGQSDEIETYAYNALGALHTNASVVLDDLRNKLSGGGTADAAVPNTYNAQPVTLDPGGRITAVFGNTLKYNRRGRLFTVKLPAPVNGKDQEYFAYDSQFRRIGRFGVNGGSPINDFEYFIWDGPNLIASQDTQNVHMSWFYEAVDQPLRVVAADGSLHYYEVDLAGNVRRLRAPDGTDEGGYRYTAFGQEYAHDSQAPALTIEQPLRWKARYWSDFSQLYDVRARWWSPQLGVFTSIDELAYQDPESTLWSWPKESPIRWDDPTGRSVYKAYGGMLSAETKAEWWAATDGASDYFAGLANSAWSDGNYAMAAFDALVSFSTTVVSGAVALAPVRHVMSSNEIMMGAIGGMAMCPEVAETGAYEEGAYSNVLNYTPRDLQKGFMKHGEDFGLSGNWNPARSADFSAAVNQHINDPTVLQISGTYRNTIPVTHFYNPATGLNVMTTAPNIYLSGWSLSEEQTANLLRTGNVQ